MALGAIELLVSIPMDRWTRLLTLGQVRMGPLWPLQYKLMVKLSSVDGLHNIMARGAIKLLVSIPMDRWTRLLTLGQVRMGPLWPLQYKLMVKLSSVDGLHNIMALGAIILLVSIPMDRWTRLLTLGQVRKVVLRKFVFKQTIRF